MPNRPVAALDIGVLLWLSGLDVLDRNPMFVSTLSQRFADVFRAIVDPDRHRLSRPFDDPVEASCHPLGGPREIDLDPQTFAVEIIQNGQKPKSPAVPFGQPTQNAATLLPVSTGAHDREPDLEP